MYQPPGIPPHLDKPDSKSWQQYNSAIAKSVPALKSLIDDINTTLALLGQTAVADASSSTVSVTSADVAAIAAANGSTVTGTATTPGTGFADDTELNAAITAINTHTTLVNELKTNIATVRTLVNELKSDVNTLKTDLNAVVTNQNLLISALQTAGIII